MTTTCAACHNGTCRWCWAPAHRKLHEGGANPDLAGLAAVADRARPTIGVSPGAWQEAAEVMGSQNASITLAAILQRAERIRSCGGYLRDLTEKARAQKFSVWPMVTALLNARVGALEKAAAGKGAEESSAAQERGGCRGAARWISATRCATA
ncbi:MULTISPECIES: replication initiation protein RepC [Mesorhizobium]|uniref:Replication initiation protein RepC n=3 Tax=Mesorhizobium TaxID=68287 RepID=A0ABU4WZE5_9HYPH|nr:MULTISPECIES: replication initiation protein RepC [unclassified Mesorhizobium]MDX8441422.1 replication initiation protein RepC [Mesorhizobium sp. VK3E]MDX8449228.1 replication initiation protein RepC [Mesorhizobium sp. VK3C]MDX8469971.1 replication initiation protein RepC [Mesorhizobium sp. VK23B]MDX8476324.1 replication initiation protein RepC [Mesorhizobium sp. VK23A]MDX8503236.1 replication initiation protein RepC [Mesorhizobium sp. VK4C]